jgi:hypothetical protein
MAIYVPVPLVRPTANFRDEDDPSVVRPSLGDRWIGSEPDDPATFGSDSVGKMMDGDAIGEDAGDDA